MSMRLKVVAEALTAPATSASRPDGLLVVEEVGHRVAHDFDALATSHPADHHATAAVDDERSGLAAVIGMRAMSRSTPECGSEGADSRDLEIFSVMRSGGDAREQLFVELTGIAKPNAVDIDAELAGARDLMRDAVDLCVGVTVGQQPDAAPQSFRHFAEQIVGNAKTGGEVRRAATDSGGQSLDRLHKAGVECRHERAQHFGIVIEPDERKHVGAADAFLADRRSRVRVPGRGGGCAKRE